MPDRSGMKLVRMSDIPFDERWQLQHEDGSPVTDPNVLADMTERWNFASRAVNSIAMSVVREGFMDDKDGQD